MKILPGIEIKGKSLWFPKKKILIVADLHLGYEESLNEQGLLVPRLMFKQTKKEIKELLKLKPRLIIINGDLKHRFGKISQQEWHECFEILDILLKKCKVILIKGNHDTILEPIAKKKGLEIKDFYCFNKSNICVTHGHKIFSNKKVHNSKVLIIGHEHPAISIKEGIKSEKYKCFLLGRWKRKKMIVMPSFLTISIGYDMKNEKPLGPYLNSRNIRNCEVFIVGENNKIYRFEKIRNMK